jgi:16S rRNA G1207 methylase RsmC
MKLEFPHYYDLIVMNPPFSKQQDIDHVSKALDILRTGGILISIMPEGTFFRQNKKTVAFWKKVYDNSESCDIIELPENSFKSSGTMVRTRILWIKK